MSASRPFLLESPETVEGIGSKRAAALSAGGIETIGEMFRAGAQKVHALCPGSGAREVGRWFCAAALRRVDRVDPQIAEALVAAGIRTVGALAAASLESLERAMEDARAAHRIAEAPSLYALSDLQKRAAKCAAQGMLAGRIRRRDGTPVPGARVDLGSLDATTDAAGRFAFERVDAGASRIVLEVPGRSSPLELPQRTVRAGKLTGPIDLRIDPDAAPSALRVVRERDGALLAKTRGVRVQTVWVPIAELPEGTLLSLRHLNQDGTARLMSYDKELVGRVLRIPLVRVSIASLPAGATAGNVLAWRGGRLEPTDLSPEQVAALKRERFESNARRTSRRILWVEVP